MTMVVRSGADWSAAIEIEAPSGAFDFYPAPGRWVYNKGLPMSNVVLGPGQIRSGLTIGWKLPTDGLYPTAPEPTTAEFSIVVEDAADLAFIDVGSPVTMDFYLGVTDGAPTFTPLPSVSFQGRVSQMDGSPLRVNGHDGYQLDLVCVDYTADLGEVDIAGVIPFQGIGVQTVVESLFGLAGKPAPNWTTGGWGCAQLVLNDGVVEPGALGEAVDTILSSYADGGNIIGAENVKLNHEYYPLEGWRRGYLQPTCDTYGNLTGYQLEWFSQRNTIGGSSTADTFPLELYYAGGLFRLQLAAPVGGSSLNARQVISADYLDFRANWKRTKNSSPTAVIVASNVPSEVLTTDPFTQVQLSTTEPRPQVATRVTDFKGYMRFNAEFTAEMLVPDPAPYRDLADGFVYYADQDPQWPLVPSWFPSDDILWFGHSVPILLTDIPASQSPADPRGWYAGTIAGARFTIDRGATFRFDIELRPGAPLPGGFYAANAWNYMPANQPSTPWAPGGVAWTPANTDPTLTVQDFRLARRHM